MACRASTLFRQSHFREPRHAPYRLRPGHPAARRHAALDVGAATVAAALQAAFAREPRLRGYLLDDQGSLRRHVALFVDGVQVRDRRGLGDPLQDDSEIYVVQALSGG